MHNYGQNRQMYTNEVSHTCGVGVWKSIGNLWLSFLILSSLRVKIGRGDKFLFSKENWSGHGNYQSFFHSLFLISLNPNFNIQEVVTTRCELDL